MRALLLLCLVSLAAATSPPVLQTCRERLQELENREQYGPLPPGAEKPICEEDGSYAPKQCTGSECYCVLPHGEQLQYSQNRGDGDKMHCGCARKEHEYDNSTPLLGAERPICDQLGNYEPRQCQGSRCHCVSKHGLPLVNGNNDRYGTDRGDASPLRCTCALHDHRLLQEANGRFGAKRVSCDKRGDYERIQCTGSVCSCVDRLTGKEEADTETNIGYLAELESKCQ